MNLQIHTGVAIGSVQPKVLVIFSMDFLEEWVAVRFTDVAVPQGATVTLAYASKKESIATSTYF